MNIHAIARKLQLALSMKGKYISINQYQAWSDRAERMVTKFVVCERRIVKGKPKNVSICETYQMAEVVKALASLLNDGGGS